VANAKFLLKLKSQQSEDINGPKQINKTID